jgi:hypothetical protein
MRKYTLIEAIIVIASIYEVDPKEILMCELEDGSQRKFNFRAPKVSPMSSIFIDFNNYSWL